MHLRSGRGDPRGPFVSEAFAWTLSTFPSQLLLHQSDRICRRVFMIAMANKACAKFTKRVLVSEAQRFRSASRIPTKGSLTWTAMYECCEFLQACIKILDQDTEFISVLEWKLSGIINAIDLFVELEWCNDKHKLFGRVKPNEHMIVDESCRLLSAFHTAPWIEAYSLCVLPIESVGWRAVSTVFQNDADEYDPTVCLRQIQILQSDLEARRRDLKTIRRRPTPKRHERDTECALM